MSKVLCVCAAMAALLAPTTGHAGLGIGFYKYDAGTLFMQEWLCESEGPDPSGGCDQCMPRSLVSQLATFCGPSYDCAPHWLRGTCQVCNGACTGTVGSLSGGTTTILALHSPHYVDIAISGCKQWVWQRHCSQAAVYGAYNKIFELSLGSIPGFGTEHYGELRTDPLFWDAVAAQVPLAGSDSSERAWRQRLGVFTMIVDGQGGPVAADPYYTRALYISAWVWLDLFRPGGYSPVDIGFPSDMPPDDVVAQARAIEWATCSEQSHFGDCGLTPVEPKTWGALKQHFR